ncbi:MAG: flippase-like domain-containing protein [Anaerolineae bacterium]|nr:flippase-like domain-containing protein [Anaerolineae bacterium]
MSKKRGWLTGALSLILSIAGLVFLFSRLDIEAVRDALRTVDYGYFLLSLLIATLVQFFFPWRWRVLLNYRVSLWHSSTACFAGDFVNALTPLRMGEIVRATLIRRSEGISLSEALSTIVLAQLLDLLALVAVGVLLLLVAPLPEALVQAGAVIGVLSLIGLAVLMVAAYRTEQIHARIEPLLSRLAGEQRGGRVLRLIRGALDGLQTLRSPLQLLYAAGISLGLWLIIAFSGWVLLRGMMPNPGLELGLAVSFAGGIGRLLPALPGSIGTLDFAVMFSLTTLGVPDEVAIAFVLLLRLRYVLHTAITGSVALVSEGMNLHRLRQLVNEPTP